MASAPPHDEIDSYVPHVDVGPPNHPYVTVTQYHKQLLEMAMRNKATPTIQEVANALNIPFAYAVKLQNGVDDIKREARDAFRITSGTSKRTQPYYKGGRKSRRYSKKSGRKSRRYSKKSSKRSCRR